MITANELRIKNKLQKDNGEIFTVLRIDNTNDVLVEEQRGLLTLNHNLFGIPLTPSILEKCDDPLSKIGYELRKVIINGCIRLHLHIGISYIQTADYLHEYQNLVFALTGQELEVNL